jgi:hypothetical protein
MTRSLERRTSHGEAGFTLVEALISVLVLVFGLMGVANLFALAASSNSTANHATAAVAEATETMERLKAIPFTQLVPGGDIDNPLPAPAVPGFPGAADVTVNTYNRIREIPGVGVIRTTWTIVRPGAGGPDTLFIRVRSESTSVMRGRRSRAEFTTFRTCTTAGCP